jgi:hypothetical protein
MFSWLKKTFWQVVAWFKPEAPRGSPMIEPEQPWPHAEPDLGCVPQPIAEPTVDVFPRPPRAKWVKPKGLEKLQHKPRETPVAPRPRSAKPRPNMRPDDNPERWGQYFFRDAILDQLDVYFLYLHRMRKCDRDAYELHRQLGIQIMPQNAVENFDKWRGEGELDELSAWWTATRPAFGAIAYGIDKGGLAMDRMRLLDAPPEVFATLGRDKRLVPDERPKYRIATVTGSKEVELPDGSMQKTGILWVPKFLYFYKYKRPPSSVEKVSDGDVYSLTIYWDRVAGQSNTFHKRNKGGFPQEYAVCVERDSKRIRVLRRMLDEPLRIRSYRTGGSFNIPNKRWGYGDAFLRMMGGHLDCSPEDFLRRCFIEAALMYETAAMGSMIRVVASKGKLNATFGVEIKRTSYFFKDRDVTLTDKGRRARIFHIVRPHVRHTKRGEEAVRLHFRGLRKFTWAGYRIDISVPGLDAFNVAELDVGISEVSKLKDAEKGSISMKEVGEMILAGLQKGRGKWNQNATRH